jgi:hypothetical protein
MMYLKNNTTPIPIASPNARSVVSGVVQTGELVNFVKDSGSNSLIYKGLDANADRVSESEIYVNAGTPSNQPQSAAVQTVTTLNYNDRVFLSFKTRIPVVPSL